MVGVLDGDMGKVIKTGINMIITKEILDELSAKAMASPRLRINMDLRNGIRGRLRNNG